MDTSILEFLNKAGKFSDEESSLLQNEVIYKELKKDAFLLNKGEVCSSLYFVISGSFY
ncbi:Crp/Fnr family transcriptional regulator, partial [Aquimarina sp. AD1]